MSDLGIEKIIALLKVVEHAGVAVEKISADGKIDMNDLPVAVGLISVLSDDIKAIKSAKGALKQAKDLDKDEVKEIIDEIYRIVKAIEDADK